MEDTERLAKWKREIVGEVNKDIALAISTFKVWLLATILSNVLLVGLPALYVFFTTQQTSQYSFDEARRANNRHDANARWAVEANSRLLRIEAHLETRDKLRPVPQREPLPQ